MGARLRRWSLRHRWKLITGTAGLLALFIWARWGPMDPLFSAPRSTVVLAQDGQLLGATTARDGQWRFPQRDSVPERFRICITTFEDRHFATHHGVHLPSLVRAVRQNVRAGRTVSGGSTITMQVARLSRPGSTRSYLNKVIEAFIALRLELRMSKAEILALYVANAPFGGNVVGLDAAAWRWFGRSADDLTWSECATLAVLPNAPSILYPGKGQEALRAKRDRLLDRLLTDGHIDRMECSLAKDEALPGRPHPLPGLAPHLLGSLQARGGEGRIIHTTVDADLQARCNEAAARYAQRLVANEVHNCALLVLDVHTGQVRAYVGNLPGTGAAHAGMVDIVRARRSTGSLLKPFLHADMLGTGELTPGMLLPDVPTQYDGFAPRNYDERYNGAVPADEALARSLNVPAVRNLRTHGIDRTLRMLRAMGLHSIHRTADHYGLSLIMGGAECSLWELAGAYASMARVLHHHARGGRAYRPGDVHAPLLLAGERPDTADATALSPLSAASIHCTLKALREVARPEEEAGWRNFQGDRAVAWKTGTSVGHRDAWAIGVTDRWCVAVWTGNASGEGRPGLTGTLAAAPLLFDVFALLPTGPGFDAPEDELVALPICPRSGHRAGLDCPDVDTLRLPAPCARTPVCPYHRTITVDASGTHRVPPPGAARVPWFVLPPAMERYYLALHPDHRPLPPSADGASADEVIMEVLYPERGARLLLPVDLDGSLGKAVVEVAHRDPRARVHWDLDGIYLGATIGDHRMALAPEEGRHVLTFTDDAGRSVLHPFHVVRRADAGPAAPGRTARSNAP